MKAQMPRTSWMTLTVIGLMAIAMGIVFVTLRPLIVLLPEDQRFTGLTPDQLRRLSPELFAWIGMVFRSWGAFAIGLGAFMTAIAMTAYRRGEKWSWWTMALAGTSTFAIFLTVNMVLGSDFRWVIALLLGLFWVALGLGRKAIE